MKNQHQQSSYRQLFKATSLFGGVQLVNIFIYVLRSKMIAILLGPAGMGVFGLFTTALNLIGGISGFGLGSSAVRAVAEANENGDTNRLLKTVAIVRKLVWITGVLGALMAIIFAPLLSKATFGTFNYTTAFYILSVSLLFNQLTVGQNVLLQGLRQLKYLAKANVLGAAISLFVSLPLYYWFRINGIVPAVVITAGAMMFIAWYFSRKMQIDKVWVSRKEIWGEGKEMLKIGFFLSLSSFVGLGESYLVRIFIGKMGTIEDVGFYNAGFMIIGTYVGMIFTAMSTDYYPRLAGIASKRDQLRNLVNQQAELAVLILAPILCIFLVFIHWGIIILYTNQFAPINGMVQWAALGMYFKAVTWAVGFIFLASGNAKLFFWSEMISIGTLLLCNITGYWLWGLEGLGISFLVGYIICFFQVSYWTRRFYLFFFEKRFWLVFLIQLNIGILCFLAVKFLAERWAYGVGGILIVVSASYSFFQIDKKIGLLNMIQRFIKEKKGS
ncbi:O-antigen translocase [Niabella sp. CC-SYL272]|uniref:O-antigen translocase n=1 Tax=Niabella agricola TaxID=2891571 RepID=UPI001F2C3402|nr:O-antigen translocase [Niabella agricola]MCF3109938.1 O-antigen translocase [Niabella agricola]